MSTSQIHLYGRLLIADCKKFGQRLRLPSNSLTLEPNERLTNGSPRGLQTLRTAERLVHAVLGWRGFWAQLAWPDIYRHDGTVTLCSSACSGVDALALGSQFDSTMVIDVGPSDQFNDDDVTYARISIFNPALPNFGLFGDPATDNPLILAIEARTIESALTT